MPQGNQIYLDYCLDYTSSVTISGNQELVNGEALSSRADYSRKRVYQVPDSQLDGVATTFVLPEDAIGASLEVFYRGLMVDPSVVTHPLSDQVGLPFAPEISPLYIHYLPVVGLPSGQDNHVGSTIVSSSGPLTVDQVNGKLVLFDTSSGDLSVVLPDVRGLGGVQTYLKNIGSGNVLIEAFTGTVINKNYTTTSLNGLGASGKITYIDKDRNWMPKQTVEEVGYLFNVQPSMDDPLFDFIWEPEQP